MSDHNETRPLDLDEIEAWAEYAAPRVGDLVRGLVAEVRRLREAFAESVEERARLEDIIAERT